MANTNLSGTTNGTNTLNGSNSSLNATASNALDSAKEAGKHISAVAREEITNLKADFDNLIARLPSLNDADLAAAKQKLFEKLDATQASARGVVKEVRQQLNHSVDVTTDYVKDKPLQSVAAAAGVGILLGLLIARR